MVVHKGRVGVTVVDKERGYGGKRELQGKFTWLQGGEYAGICRVNSHEDTKKWVNEVDITGRG